MDNALTPQSIRTYFNFPFRSPDWLNRFLIGVALFFIAGYAAEIMRRTASGQAPDLPEWNDWGRLLLNGLRMIALQWIFLLPGIIVMFGGFMLYFFGIFASIFAAEQSEAAASLTMLLVFLVFMLSIPVSTLLFALGAVPLPAATVHMVVEERFSAGFQFSAWSKVLRANGWGYFVAWVGTAGLMTILYVAFMLIYSTLILCFLLPVVIAPIGFYLAIVSAALFGEAYHAGQQTGLPATTEPAPAAPEGSE